MRGQGTRTLAALVVLAMTVALAGCGSGGGTDDTSGDATPKGPIKVGSKIDTEGSILGQIIILKLRAEGFEVEDKTRTGATKVVRDALTSGQIDIYPEYTANVLVGFHADQDVDPAILTDAERTYEKARDLDLELSEVAWLKPAPANNTWAVAVPREFGEANGLESMEDWAAYINGGGTVKIVGSQEFFTSDAAMPTFEKEYGFKLKTEQIVALATGDTAVTEKAAAEGTDGANAAMAYGTDGTIAALDLVVLSDPKGAQPIYQPAPTLRAETLEKYPEIAEALDPVFAKLDLQTLQKLNAEVAIDNRDPKAVAEDWLKSEGLL